jgi:uncharacterized lipoprotein YmbA
MKRLVIVAILFTVGCASQTPELKQYLLRTDTANRFAEQDPTAVVGIGALTVASYIDGRGLVLESSNGAVRTARYHQWAEPLRESLRTFLANEIAMETGHAIRARRHGESNWKRRIDVHIDQLHGTAGGDARLVAYWAVLDSANQAVLAESGFSDSEALSGDGYDALVQAEKTLLRRLAAAIAATL